MIDLVNGVADTCFFATLVLWFAAIATNNDLFLDVSLISGLLALLLHAIWLHLRGPQEEED